MNQQESSFLNILLCIISAKVKWIPAEEHGHAVHYAISCAVA